MNLKRIFIGLIGLGLVLAFSFSCDPGQDDGEQDITILLSFENHLQENPIHQVNLDTQTGQRVSINIAQYNFIGVSQNFAVALNQDKARVGHTFNGTLTFTATSDASKTNYTIILFDIGSTAEENQLYESAYAFIANEWQTYGGLSLLKRILPVHRVGKDGRTGPENVYTGVDAVFDLMNNYLNTPPGSSVKGLIDVKTSSTGTSDPYGFAWCGGFDGDHSDGIFIDPDHFDNIKDPTLRFKAMKRTAMEEAVERYGKFNNILGRPSQMIICDPYDAINNPNHFLLNGTGVRVLRFVAAYAQ